jgi:hypothetical protein
MMTESRESCDSEYEQKVCGPSSYVLRRVFDAGGRYIRAGTTVRVRKGRFYVPVDHVGEFEIEPKSVCRIFTSGPPLFEISCGDEDLLIARPLNWAGDSFHVADTLVESRPNRGESCLFIRFGRIFFPVDSLLQEA